MNQEERFGSELRQLKFVCSYHVADLPSTGEKCTKMKNARAGRPKACVLYVLNFSPIHRELTFTLDKYIVSVERALEWINTKKSIGPDYIPNWLASCGERLN